MSVGIPIHENTFPTWAERSSYFTQLRDKIAALPDVLSTGISTNATPPDSGWGQPFDLQGKTASEDQKASINFVDSRLFQCLADSPQDGDVCGTRRNCSMALSWPWSTRRLPNITIQRAIFSAAP